MKNIHISVSKLIFWIQWQFGPVPMHCNGVTESADVDKFGCISSEATFSTSQSSPLSRRNEGAIADVSQPPSEQASFRVKEGGKKQELSGCISVQNFNISS